MSKNFTYSLVFLFTLLLVACVPNETATIDSKSSEFAAIKKREIPFEFSIDKVKYLSKDTTITIPFDKAFPEPMTFRGFPLKPIIEAFKLEDIDNLQATFVCSDGYKPSIPLSEIAKQEGYITYQNTEEQLAIWADSIKANIPPYYLTWKTDSLNKDLINPYGVISLRIEAIGFNYEKIIPAKVEEDSLLSKGFSLYEKMCMKCHSINKEGGDLGPELNYPKNITEYQGKEFILAFVKSPQSFRYNSKMPPVPLSDEKLELIYDYLEVMKEYKIEED